MIRVSFIFFIVIPVFAARLHGQEPDDTTLLRAGLQDCIKYSLEHQPSVKQNKIDEEITGRTIKSKLADWYPQISLSYSLQHNLQLPTSFLPDANGEKRPVRIGVKNTSNIQFSLSQNIFNRDALLARNSAADVRLQSRQLTANNKTDVVVAVSKAFYDLLLTQKQVQVLDENIVRLKRSLSDAFNQYKGGIVDKIDYKRAQIALNNTEAQRKKTADAVVARYDHLKELMGYPVEKELSIAYDSIEMEKDAYADTLQTVQYSNRIEYKLLRTEQRLLADNVAYNRWSYLPDVSAVGSYSPAFQNDRFASLYGIAYPTSYIGLQLNFPIFQGGKRVQDIRIAELRLQRVKWDIASLASRINTEYQEALAAYKGNLAELNALKENLSLAEDVYNTLRLQYSAGIKTYLDVIIAETDLRSTQINYFNALYQVLASKIDLRRALGTITY